MGNRGFRQDIDKGFISIGGLFFFDVLLHALYSMLHTMDHILLIDKPAGITSHDVVDRVRKIFQTRQVGHAGTLDPFATGLLIVGVGAATKELSTYVGLDKTYVATARLGATSTTDDPEGVISPFPYEGERVGGEAIEHAFKKFRGEYLQISPLYSAKKVGGKKMYELARKGLGDTVERPKKLVTIYALRTVHDAWPDLTFEVTCSSGTYIRALARDIGEILKTGAYLTALRRTRIGMYDLKDAKSIDSLTNSRALDTKPAS